MQGRALNKTGRRGLADSARFLKTLVAAPRLTGAVAPSGRALARAMAAAIGSPSQGLVVELGPGTGPVTRVADRDPHLPRTARAGRVRSGLLPRAGGTLRGRPRHPGRRLRLAPHARVFRGPADRRCGLQPAVAQSTAASSHETDRRRLRADGACGRIRPVHLWASVACSARSLRQSLFRSPFAPDPAQSAPGFRVDVSTGQEERGCCQRSVNGGRLRRSTV